MNSLEKRVDILEQESGTGSKAFLCVQYASDGGLVYDGRFYPDAAALLDTFGHGPDEAFILGWKPGETAAELLAEAEERAKNPPPEVALDDLGEYGRQLVEKGVTPAVAKALEAVQANREEA
jgi:hypothetical protein